MIRLIAKFVLTFVLTLLLSGCLGYIDCFFGGKVRSVGYDADLKGLTKPNIIKRLGQPHSKQVFFDYKRRQDQWLYSRKAAKDMYVVFTNGYVSDVFYE